MNGSRVDGVGKLVRDQIPDLIHQAGDQAVCWQIAKTADYLDSLFDKAIEELTELRDASDTERLGELADLFEVVRALAAAMGHSLDAIVAEADEKRLSHGGFAKGVWLEKVIRAEATGGPARLVGE